MNFNNQSFFNKFIVLFCIIYGVLFGLLFYSIYYMTQKTEDSLIEHAMNIMETRWSIYQFRFNKTYSSQEDHDESKIIRHQLSDMPPKSNTISSMIKNKLRDILNKNKIYFISSKKDSELPKHVDWRKNGAVTSVKKQKECGACWAFSAAGAMESHYFLKNGQLFTLSPQQLIDCSSINGNKGCKGGNAHRAFEYIQNYGITTELNYPYVAKEQKCQAHKKTFFIKNNGFRRILKGNEQHLKEAVATQGPVTAALNGEAIKFENYTEGLYEDNSCEDKALNHAVLVIGYGTDSSNRDYWIIKSTWGREWGEKGYMKLVRNKNKKCNLASLASFPVLK